MSIRESFTAQEIIITNEKLVFRYFPEDATFNIESINGSLINLRCFINVDDQEKKQNYMKGGKSNISGKVARKKMKKVVPFGPQPIKSSAAIEDYLNVSEFQDPIGTGRQYVFSFAFTSPVMEGKFDAEFIAKIYQYNMNREGSITLAIKIKSWSGFAQVPKIHSIAPLFGDAETKWKISSDYTVGPTGITFLRNGYQSWTPSELNDYDMKSRVAPIKIGKINLQNQDPIINTRYMAEMVTAITDSQSEKSIVLGFITNESQFTRVLMERLNFNKTFNLLIALSQFDSIAADKIEISPLQSEELYITLPGTNKGSSALRDWAMAAGIRGKSRILNISEKDAELRRDINVLSGWCSWYYYYTKITESEMMKNIDFFGEHKEFPIDIIQLDDGYQMCIGDYTSVNEKFPKGMKWLVDQIHQKGYIAGLWIAPFFAPQTSQVYQAHPDWFLKDDKGKLIKVTYNWGKFQYGLDLSNPDVIEHVKQLVDTIVNEWGFDFIKIDFIYSSEPYGAVYRNPNMTRAQVLRRGVQAIRDAMGDKILLGCGAPLGPCIGLVDVMRIGMDTAATWNVMGPVGDFVHSRFNIDIPALKPALLNTMVRSFMHNTLWYNDPDCVVVRENKSKLKLAEVQLQLTVFGLSGGQVFFSDDLTLLAEDRLYYMNLIIPPYRDAAIPLDLLDTNPPRYYGMYTDPAIGSRVLLSVINWENSKEEEVFNLKDIFTRLDAEALNGKEYIVFDFWKDDEFKILGKFNTKERIHLYVVPVHGCKYLSIIPADPLERKEPIFLSSNLHITQGCKEVSKFAFDAETKKLYIEFDIKGIRSGEIFLLAPSEFEMGDGFPEGTEELDTDFGKYYVVPVNLPADNKLELQFK